MTNDELSTIRQVFCAYTGALDDPADAFIEEVRRCIALNAGKSFAVSTTCQCACCVAARTRLGRTNNF